MISLSVNQPFKQLASQLINQVVSPSVKQPFIQLASQLINQIVSPSVYQPFIQLASQLQCSQSSSLSIRLIYRLSQVKSKALDNIYRLFKQNIKSRNPKRRRQSRRTVKNNNRFNYQKSKFAHAAPFFCTFLFCCFG